MVLKQKTVKKEIVFHGRGLFSGQDAVVRLIPAAPNSGIVFRRTDLAGTPTIPAKTEQVKDAIRCTKVVEGGCFVQTIEHFMAAVQASEIDNLIVDISASEMPIFDGSSKPFMQMIDEAGTVQQAASRDHYVLDQPVSWTQGDMHLIALPSNEYRISYTLHYPESPYLKSQFYSFVVTPETFRQEIASCRTFTLYQEISPLIEEGLLKNANLECGVVIDGDKVLNPEGVRFPDEMVRHKILDIIGDFALLGCQFHAHLIAIKTGHAANHSVAKELRKFLRKK
ncbi:MAG TPA: UDP-3-O-acyl-N-acetylglucosamine deacetylase [Rhabdochlamydiaceae bacterium]|jgi:UDP-3-O-[3-hydroxymyristoyl] N-acetylglucosamine deacetylase|nr:UDP-3-O-acyl-N-acetylglucosamine deacetylase [Rhabdochlamydiaceae bacterium]